MLNFFNFVEIDSFATHLAQEFSQRMPLKVLGQANRKISSDRVTLIVDSVIMKAAEFSSIKRIGWLGKARLGMSFKWELKNLGYPEDIADILTKAVIVHIAGRKKTTKDTKQSH